MSYSLRTNMLEQIGFEPKTIYAIYFYNEITEINYKTLAGKIICNS